MPKSTIEARIQGWINADGPIPLDRFWHEAMTAPGDGYYMHGAPIGTKGDFTTAPEISQIFGELVGLWLIDAWSKAGEPSPFTLMELGPGRGQLMADILRVARLSPAFLAAARVVMVEASPSLAAVQRERLANADLQTPPTWRSDWRAALVERNGAAPDGTEPDQTPIFLVANEFLDALPIRQFERTAGTWHERLVGLDGDGAFTFVSGLPAPVPDAARPPPEPALPPEGAILEYAPERLETAAAIAKRIAALNGAALLIDYGYSTSRIGDTLQALANGARANPLANPGGADITSHIDFEALARTARLSGARAWGAVDQGVFLLRLGAEARGEQLAKAAAPAAAAEIKQGLRRLVHPRAMGTLFKALAITPPNAELPAGFEA